MSIVIYTYHDPYKIDQEPYWDEIKNCPYFCSAQTLVNGLRSHYKEKFDGGRVSTVKILTDSLYIDWASPAWIVKQHTDIDNIINSGFSTDLSESERINIGRAFLFNRDDVFVSYVLKAMGIPEEEIECSVRISWGPDTSANELKENLVKMIEIAKQIKG